MAPSKKKVTERKRVLVLEPNQAISNPSVSTWQGKYQQLVALDGSTNLNGTSENITSTTSENPLLGLVGQYASDSESDDDTAISSKVDDFLKELESESCEKEATSNCSTVQGPADDAVNNIKVQVPGSAWVQCYDDNSGYPYYWNQITNQVCWQPPQELVAAINIMRKTAPSSATSDINAVHKVNELNKQSTKTKYPWTKDSESDDEKIELITSYGDSDEESEASAKRIQTTKKKIKFKIGSENSAAVVGPQPSPSSGPSSGGVVKEKAKNLNAKRKTKNRALNQKELPMVGPQLPEELEIRGVDDTSDNYETSSLMTPLVPDTGPPGTDGGSEISSTDVEMGVPDSSAKELTEDDLLRAKSLILKKLQDFENEVSKVSKDVSDSSSSEILNKLKVRALVLSSASGTAKSDVETTNSSLATTSADIAPVDDIMALIEQETPPDYVEQNVSKKDSASTPFKLIASYGDDSDTEESSTTGSKVDGTPKPLFPSAVLSNPPATSSKTLDTSLPAHTQVKAPPTTSYMALDAELPDSTTTHKAFKRKKRIEVTAPSESVVHPSTSKNENYPAVVEPVTESNHRYNMDPTSNEHRGFGFSPQTGPAVKKGLGIQFIKAETINFTPPAANCANQQTSIKCTEDPNIRTEDVEEAAEILTEKLEFLAEGKGSVSVVHQMAIQLETLVSAWQAGALTLTYLSNWLATRSLEVMEKEVTAAPQGWSCIWDRKSKRYFYRNKKDGTIVWDYPSETPCQEVVSPKEDINNGTPDAIHNMEDEMELSTTPPTLSAPSPPPISRREQSPPPPPDISSRNDVVPQESAAISSRNDTLSPPAPVIPSRLGAAPPPPPPPAPALARDSTPPPPPPPIITINAVVAERKTTAGQVSSSSEDKLLIEEHPPSEPPPPGVDDVTAGFIPPLPVRLQPPPPPPDSSSSTTMKPPVPATSVSSSNAHEVSTSRSSTKRKRNLTSELDSFYADLAKLEGEGSVSTSDTVADPPDPPPPPAIDQLPPPPPPDEPPKKKKKAPAKIGKSLKKKGVSSLVAKWQQVQEEARRKYGSSESDDDEPDVSSTYK